MPNARMSLWTQSVHSFSFPPRPLRTAPSKFPKTIRFGSRPPLIRRSVPAHKSLLVRNVISMLSHTPGYLKGTVVRSHPMVWSLALCPDDTKQDTVVNGAEFGVVFLAKGSRTPPLCQTPGCRSGRYRSTLSPSHPVLSVLHPQGFRK